MNKQLISILSFLPSDKIKVSELKRGDVAQIHAQWDMVLETGEIEGNNGWNFSITRFSGGTSYLPPSHDIKIVKRGLFNTEELEKFIAAYVEEQRIHKEECEREEEEERERERALLKERLRELE